ncbi:hypothetical protein OF83DRAFT_167021 [Amylostereum chailletii]|nr:hypothetical protein OF83DRAFT_167021 [Amylostereum chailletii]
MPNWQDPVLIASQYQSFVILQHALAGVWLCLGILFEFALRWQLVRRAKITWTPWMYIMCRIFGLGAMITIITGFDLQVEINCRAWLVFVYFFVYGATFLASSLIGIRVVAVWNRNIFVIVFVAMTLLAFAGTFLHGLIVARAEWSDAAGTCAVGATTQNLPNTIAGLVVDTTLLGMMLVGLLRWREARNYGVWQVLWKQGLLWVLLATIAEVPTVVFISLNLNDPMNLMMLTPEFMILLIGSTRMYRGLTNFFSAEYAHPARRSSVPYSPPTPLPHAQPQLSLRAHQLGHQRLPPPPWTVHPGQQKRQRQRQRLDLHGAALGGVHPIARGARRQGCAFRVGGKGRGRAGGAQGVRVAELRRVSR